MTDKPTPAAALKTLQDNTAALYRHGPNGSREFLSLATRLDTGIWAGVEDRGVFPGRVYGETCGTEVAVDLFLHVATAPGQVTELPVQWAMRTVLRPIALLGVPGDVGEAPQIVSTGEMSWPEYQHIHRPVLKAREKFEPFVCRADITFDAPVTAQEGAIHEQPTLQRYRSGSDATSERSAICVSANYGNPSEAIIGGAVVDDFGRLVGVTIGVDPGPQEGHIGLYVPADFIVPALQIAVSAVKAMGTGERFSTRIALVQFWNTDVDLDPVANHEPRPRHYLDLIQKAALPRRSWRSLLELARAGAETGLGEEPAHRGSIRSLADIVES